MFCFEVLGGGLSFCCCCFDLWGLVCLFVYAQVAVKLRRAEHLTQYP